MRKIDRLRHEALQSCNSRGHTMKRFRYATTSIYSPSIPDFGYSECKICKAHVVLDTSPAPNGIDIGGPAVAIGCGDNHE